MKKHKYLKQQMKVQELIFTWKSNKSAGCFNGVTEASQFEMSLISG